MAESTRTMPATPTEARLVDHSDQLRAFRASLIEKGGYLGDDSFSSQAEWRRMGRMHELVRRESTITANAAQTSGGLLLLSAVVSIPHSKFRLTAWNWWKEDDPLSYARTLADVKLSCLGEAPVGIDIFRDDFAKVLSNAELLMKTSATPGFKKKGLLEEGVSGSPGTKLRVRHKLFSEVEDDPSETEDTDAAFKIENWPADSAAIKAALVAMHNSHTVNPVPAYDRDGELILPQRYKASLRGAVVTVRFTLTHWSIGRRGDDSAVDVYVPNLHSMRVLIPPKAKCKISLTDTWSPTFPRMSQSNDCPRTE